MLLSSWEVSQWWSPTHWQITQLGMERSPSIPQEATELLFSHLLLFLSLAHSPVSDLPTAVPSISTVSLGGEVPPDPRSCLGRVNQSDTLRECMP
jgi:hypothetical protein